VNPLVDLWDWRRRVSELYYTVRGASDPAAAWAVWRAERERMFRSHPQSPLDPEARAAFPGLRFFPYDPALRRVVALQNLASTCDDEAAAGEDGVLRLRPFARTAGLAAALGAELTIYWIMGYGGGAFLPFGDATNGQETFGGGRYLIDTLKGADLGTTRDGRVVLDFNFAYGPSCAYSPRWVCPLPPPANRLAAPVRAGERVASA